MVEARETRSKAPRRSASSRTTPSRDDERERRRRILAAGNTPDRRELVGEIACNLVAAGRGIRSRDQNRVVTRLSRLAGYVRLQLRKLGREGDDLVAGL